MIKNWPNPPDNGRVKTVNQMGFMFVQLSTLSQRFIEYATQSTSPVIDIGCAYGVAVLPILDAESTCPVVALDTCQTHLDELLDRVPDNKKTQITTIRATFPEEFSFPDNYFQAIHIAYVLQFFKGEQLKAGLIKCFNSLKPGGKLFLYTASIYFNFWRDQFLSQYEKKSAAGVEFPGEIENQHQYLPAQFDEAKQVLPIFTHVFKLDDLVKIVSSTGFKVEVAEYDDIQGVSGYESEGKGMISIVAEKPAFRL